MREPSAGLRVAVLDPSGFTLPYDHAYCDALSEAGVRVAFVTRPPRQGEPAPRNTFETVSLFYPASEDAMRRWPRLIPIVRFGKGLEHGYGLWRFYRWWKRRRPDVVHFQWAALPILDRRLVGRLKRRSKLVLTVHDTNAFLGTASSPLQYWGWHDFLNDMDQLIVHTQEGVSALRKQGVQTPIAVLPHGPLTFDSTRALPAEEKEILLFGELKPYKGVDLFLEAFARIPAERRQGWRIRIVGKPAMDLEPLVRRARELGLDSVVLWEPRFVDHSEIAGYFARAAIVVFPYRDIDASGVLMGAMGLGKAIVATRIGAFAELLSDRQNALVVEKEDVGALAGALATLIEDPELRRRLGEACARQARISVPSWDLIARSALGIYEGLPSPG
jgi:glycosyltransferase involved in cell wall biosynthesis